MQLDKIFLTCSQTEERDALCLQWKNVMLCVWISRPLIKVSVLYGARLVNYSRRQAPVHLNQSNIKAWLGATEIAELCERWICFDCLAFLHCALTLLWFPWPSLSLSNLYKLLNKIFTNINKALLCTRKSIVQSSFPELVKCMMLSLNNYSCSVNVSLEERKRR